MDAEDIEAGRERWQQRYAEARAAGRVRDADFSTLSAVEVDPLYGPDEGADVPGFERIGWPGEYPFTRGLHATATAANRGQSANSLASVTPRPPMSATR